VVISRPPTCPTGAGTPALVSECTERGRAPGRLAGALGARVAYADLSTETAGFVGRPIVFLSDLGVRDEFVGVCHCVVERIAPGTRVIDLSHGVPPQDVLTGAILLADGLPYMPTNAVVLAIVDPGSGTDRRLVAIETTSGCALVGPDNGLLSLAWPSLGGIERAVSIAPEQVAPGVGAGVFDGRDVLAPAAAWLAGGRPLEQLGDAIEAGSLETRHIVEPEVEHHLVKGEVLDVDRFGNVRLNVRPSALDAAGLGDAVELLVTTPDGVATVQRVATYHDVAEGEYGILVDAWGWLSVIRYAASAADGLAVAPGDLAWIRPPS
jgi:S-adenosylmethionine hydrolase